MAIGLVSPLLSIQRFPLTLWEFHRMRGARKARGHANVIFCEKPSVEQQSHQQKATVSSGAPQATDPQKKTVYEANLPNLFVVRS